jgi:hypothetical protein
VRVEPIQGASQTVVIEVLGRDARLQEPLHRLGGEELGRQIQPTIAEPQPIQEHGHRRRAHTHPFMTPLVLRVEPLGQLDLPAHTRHNA